MSPAGACRMLCVLVVLHTRSFAAAGGGLAGKALPPGIGGGGGGPPPKPGIGGGGGGGGGGPLILLCVACQSWYSLCWMVGRQEVVQPFAVCLET